MNIPLIRIWELADLLEKDGQTRIAPINDKLGIAIYKDGEGNSTILVPGIIQRPSIEIESAEDYFKELQKEIKQHLPIPKIKKLVFQDGGSIHIPDWFTQWCRDQEIKIQSVDEEIKKLKKEEIMKGLKGTAKETWEDILD